MKTPFPAEEALKAVLFDIDGTLCDSDPFHYLSFRDMLQEVLSSLLTQSFFKKHL